MWYLAANHYKFSFLHASYEGLQTAGIDLVDAMCIMFVRNRSECYKNPEDYGHSLPANISPDHLAFSASTIFNRISMSSGCSGRIIPTETLNVEAFIHVLQDFGVTKTCRVLRNIQEVDCNVCFREAAKNGNLPAITYYFSDKYIRILEDKLNSEICEFEELDIYDIDRCHRFHCICSAFIPGIEMCPCACISS